MPQSKKKSKATTAAALSKGLTACAVLLASTSVSAAQTIAELPLSDEIKRLILSSLNAPAVTPGMAQSSPVGFGADWGTAFAGIGGSQNTKTSRANGGDEVDGSMSIGMGFGDSDGLFGLEATLNLISLTNNSADSGFGEDGDIGLKLHKRINGSTSFAVGAENVMGWGAADHDNAGRQHSAYAAVSHVSALSPYNVENPWAYSLTIGAGNGRFLDAKNANNDEDSVNIFASASLAFMPNISAIADWNGSSLGVAVSIVPIPNVPLSITAGVLDATDRLDEGVRYTGGIGYTLTFK